MKQFVKIAAGMAASALFGCATPQTIEPQSPAGSNAEKIAEAYFDQSMAELNIYRARSEDQLESIEFHYSDFFYGSMAISATMERAGAGDSAYNLVRLLVGFKLRSGNEPQKLKNGLKHEINIELFEAEIAEEEFEALRVSLLREGFYELPPTNDSDENASYEDGKKMMCLDGGGYSISSNVPGRKKLIVRNSCYEKYKDARMFATPLFSLARETFPEIADRLQESQIISE